MITSHRLARLERALASRARRQTCPECAGLDTATGTGTFRPSIVLPQDNGRTVWFCKSCWRTYEGRATELPDGSWQVEDMGPGQTPV